MSDERTEYRALRDFRRMLKARIGQVRDRGLPAVAREAMHRLARGRKEGSREGRCDFDSEFGTDTSGVIQPWELDIPEPLVRQAVQYGTASVDGFTELLTSLSINHQAYSFIDLGSGKGRALLLASRFPFKQIVGVELSSRLHQTSKANIERFQADWQRSRNLVSLCQNATEFQFPPHNTVLYLFNPFGAEILRDVVANLESSLRAVPRRVYILYVKPVHRRVLEESGTFSVHHAVHSDIVYGNNFPELPES